MDSTSRTGVAVQRDLFNYGELSAPAVKQCEAAVERITKYQRRMAGDIVAIGKELHSVNDKLEHGQFGEWIRHYFGWSRTSAFRMMSAAEMFGKCSKLEQMTIDTSALYLLSSNKCPDETRDEFIERAERGERITHAAVKQALAELSQEDEQAIDVPVCDDDDSGCDDIDEPCTWSLGDCVMSLHSEVQRWRMKCPKSEITELIQAIRDIADQLETRHVK